MAGTRNKAKLDEVRDEEGRRRFHGAFTGGFSAGYYNSVGSKEGWQPRTWQSSRGARGAASAQRPEDFMDDEDGLLGRELEAQLPYDTLGEQARRLVRAQAGRQAAGAAIPGIEAVDELLAPTGVAIGKKLLQLMGWKEGLGVGSRQTRKRQRGQGPAAAAAAEGAEDEGDDDDAAAFLPEHLRARAAERGLMEQGRITFARRDVESFALPAPKDDLYGLGFDPDKHAPELAALREAARARDDRGVYRMGDVKGQASSSRAGPRDATGFALDDSEDDVYDADAPLAMLRKDKGGGAGGGGGGSLSSRYDTVLRGLDEDEEDEDEARGRRGGKDAGAAHRMALEEWIGGAGASAAPAAPSRCPTDSRPVPEGFVLGVARWAFKQAFWAPPTPPRSFVPFHRFEEEEDEGERRGAHAAVVAGQRDAHRGRLVASARGTLLGEAKPEPPREGSSVFDLMSEADRGRLLGKAQAVSSAGDGGAAPGGAAAVPAPPPMGLARGGVFQGMQGALAKRFSVVEAPKTATLPEGLIEGGKGGAGGIAPSVAQPPPPPPPATLLKEPTRSQALWYPGSLLCKRFGIPVPQHAKFTPAAGAGAGAGAGTRAGGLPPPGAPPTAPSSLLSNKFDQEMAAILPGGNLLTQQQQVEAEAAAAGEDEVMEGEGAGGEEAALPAFEAKPRPAKNFFKAIFEASDSEEESEDEGSDEEEEEGGNGRKKPAAAMGGGVVKPEVHEESEPKLAGDAPTPPRPSAATRGANGGGASPPRDHFLQPAAVAEGESIEEILARGPVLIPRKKRAAAAAAASSKGGGEDEDEEEEGLVFGAAVIKKQPKKRPKPAATAAARTPMPATVVSSGLDATPPALRGGDETPPPGSTLLSQAGVPPTPPREAAAATAAAAAAASGAEEALAILSAPAGVPPPVLKKSGSSSEDGSESEEDGVASASKEGRDKGGERGSSSRSWHKKEKKRRKESKKDSKKRKHKKEERRSRGDDDDSSDDGSRRRDRKKRSKHSSHSRSHRR